MNNHLSDREKIIREESVSYWIIGWRLFVALLITIAICIPVGQVTMAGVIIIIIVAALCMLCTFFALRSNRISYSETNLYARTGIFRSSESIIPLDQVVCVNFSNGLAGKLFDYGRIRIQTPASLSFVSFPGINAPVDFLISLENQIEKRKAYIMANDTNIQAYKPNNYNQAMQGSYSGHSSPADMRSAATEAPGFTDLLKKEGCIKCISGKNLGSVINIKSGEEIIIGRDPSVSHFIIDDEKISKRHCIISYNSDKDIYLIQDVSSNGIYYENNIKMETGVVVAVPHGTIIRIGKSNNKYKLV